VQGQVVAALVIRDAVGDAISRRQAAVKPGPWPGRRAAGEALSRGLRGALRARPWEPSAGHVHARTFTSPHVGSVYLYLRRSETGLPLPEAPHRRQPYLYLRCCAPGPPGQQPRYWPSDDLSWHTCMHMLPSILPTLSEWRQRGLSCAQTKSICTKVGRQCQNHGIENGS